MVYYPVQYLIIQATPFCNLDCKYCYLPNRLQKGDFNLELIKPIFENLVASDLLSDSLSWDWHAGEPLVCGADFYKKAQDLIYKHKPAGLEVNAGMQTNATLITKELAAFFKKHNYRIGVSIDGPEEIHNYNRVTRSGKGSFSAAMKGIGYLKEAGVDFHVICVLSKNSLQHPHQIYKFFYHLGITGLAFNVEEVEGIHLNSSLSGEDNLFYSFFQTIFQLHQQNGETFLIREWEKFKNINYGESINGTTVPFTHLTVDTNGNFSTFSPELITIEKVKHHDHFIFGNVTEHLITDCLYTDNFKKVYEEIQQGVSQCKKICSYFDSCGGGMVSNKLFENGTFNSSLTMTCKLMEQDMKEIVNHFELTV